MERDGFVPPLSAQKTNFEVRMTKKYFIIAEKALVEKAIRAAIPLNSDGSIIPAGLYKIESASGHLLALKKPEDYDTKYKKWKIEDLPIAFPDWQLVLKDGRDQQETQLLHKKAQAIKEGLDWCDVVINCGDPDDEGQLIGDELIRFFQCTKPVLRLRINDTSPKDIIREMNRMEDNARWEPLGMSASARRVCDAIFGYNYTRYFSVKYQSEGSLSVGRVQTPTLGLVISRDLAIENHVKQHYYELRVDIQRNGCEQVPIPGILVLKKNDPVLDEDGHVLNRDTLSKLIGQLPKQAKGVISRKKIAENPPLPFNLLNLQVFCERRFGYKLDETMEITQKLREYGLITYNRSTVQYLNTSQFDEAPDILKAIFENIHIAPLTSLDTKTMPRCFDDKKMAGQPHHAIVPTTGRYDLDKLTEPERNVYKAIAVYYIIQFLPKRIKERSDLVIGMPDGSSICSTSIRILDSGFAAMLTKRAQISDSETALSNWPVGDVICSISNPRIEEHETKPPRRYTQASLAKDMSAIVKYVSDQRIKDLLLDKDADVTGEYGSIGTPATRDKIITTLIKRGYIKEVQSGKSAHLESTELGRSFYDMLPDNIKNVDITAEWWAVMKDIQAGKANELDLYNKVVSSIASFLMSPPPLRSIKGIKQRNSGLTIVGKCPRCGKDVVAGRKGYGCSGWRDQNNPCKFVIWKTNPLLAKSKKTVTEKMAKDLLKAGSCMATNLTSKNGKKYSVRLVLEDTGTFVNLRPKFDD